MVKFSYLCNKAHSLSKIFCWGRFLSQMVKKKSESATIERKRKRGGTVGELIKNVTEETFGQAIKEGVVLVDFFADWCGPCRMMTPVLEKLASELGNKVSILKIDIDNAQQIATQFQVTSIPTLVLFKDGKEAGRLVGLRDAEAIKEFIAS